MIQITTIHRAIGHISRMLRRIIQNSAFATLLGMAATYALTVTVAALLAADGLARKSIIVLQLLD